MSKFLKCFLILLVAIFCMGARLPGSYEWDTLQDFLNRPQDNQSRESKKPASYLKKPWLAPDNLDEMERTNWPDYAMWPYDPGGNPGYPGGPGWPDISGGFPQGRGEAWEVCHNPKALVTCGEEYTWDVKLAHWNILQYVDIKGPGVIMSGDSQKVVFYVLESANDWDHIQIEVGANPYWWTSSKIAHICTADYWVRCEEEEEPPIECNGIEPTIYSGVTSIARNANTTAWVNSGSGVSSVPPYTWSISGTGFWFDAGYTLTTATTNADLETLTVYADNTACGTATITVTDACSVVSTGYIICTTGTWGDAVLVATQTKFDVCPSYPGCKSQYGDTYNDVCLWSEYSGIFRWNQSYYGSTVGGPGCPGDDPERSGAVSLTVTDGMCTRTMDDPESNGYCAVYLYRRAWICP